MKNYVSYFRVSTQKQGLGLEAQKATVENYVKLNHGLIVESYWEKESGKDTLNRPELQKAIAHCKADGCTLVVAKLDRLSRDIMDVFSLKKDKRLEFEICDIDASDTLTLGIFATLAQKERELISKRTKEALEAKKAAGMKLGSPCAAETLRKYQQLGVTKRKEQAINNEDSRRAYAAIRFFPGSLQKKADFLNENGFRTSRGKAFAPVQVKRLLERYEQVFDK